MRNLQFYAEECMRELDALGIKYGQILRFEVNARAKKRFGCCVKKDGGFVIQISSLLLDERVDLKLGLKDTIMHELLHSCEGCGAHNARWKRLAGIVNRAYGYNIKTSSTPEEKKMPSELRDEPRYLLRCTGCKREFGFYRMCPTVKRPSAYRCGACKNRLERIK